MSTPRQATDEERAANFDNYRQFRSENGAKLNEVLYWLDKMIEATGHGSNGRYFTAPRYTYRQLRKARHALNDVHIG